MADDALDELYWVKPEDFTATRARLAAAAKEHGDADDAKRISAARKPTTAAWVVNRLALSHAKSTQRLADLRERLQAAHAEMDGERIRELSREQRKLIDELARSAFDVAEVKDPSAALREDVVGTLHAAIADPDVTGRLGRLAKAESWSGFGDFGFSTPSSPAKTEPKPRRHESQRARKALADAERAKAKADNVLSQRQAELVTARRRHEDAERALKAAEDACAEARQASTDAGELVKRAKAELNENSG